MSNNENPKLTMIQLLSATDKNVLMAIYEHRCLNEKMIHDFFYQQAGYDAEYTAERVDFFITNKLLEVVDYGAEEEALFLTTMGIKTVKAVFDMPAEIWDEKTGKLKPAMKTASKIKMLPTKIRHQMHLNSFVLRFKVLATEKGLSYQYYDETYAEYFGPCHPDGIITLNSCDIFVEMDMATERSAVLNKKWEHYRAYKKTKEYLYREKKVVVFFVTSNITRIRTRRDTVLSTLGKYLFDEINTEFDFFIGSEDQLLDVLEDRFINQYSAFSENLSSIQSTLLNSHGYSSSLAYQLTVAAKEVAFDLYIRRLNERQNIMVVDGRAQEFFVDSYFKEPISVLQKISMHQSRAAIIKAQFGRYIPYLVITDDLQSLYRDLSILDIRSVQDVFFTTLERLRSMQFYEAIIQFDGLGNVYHFSDNAFDKPVFEKPVKAIQKPPEPVK